jgi:hypothetical protein
MQLSRLRSILAVVCLLLALTQAEFVRKKSLTSIVSHLPEYRAETGGYRSSPSHSSSSQATAHTIFLANLFGQRNKLSNETILNYLDSLRNTDGGFGRDSGLASDIESTYYFVLAHKYLGIDVPLPTHIARFVETLTTKDNILISSRYGEARDLKSTVQGYQILDLLYSLSVPQKAAIREYLNTHKKQVKNFSYFSFPEDHTLTDVAANYYGIQLGRVADFQFDETFANTLINQQSPEGGFFPSFPQQGVATVESTYQAVLSLHAIGQYHLSRANVANIRSFFEHTNFDNLNSAYQAHYALALSGSIRDNFVISFTLRDSASSESVGEGVKAVTQGTLLTPVLRVRTPEGQDITEFSVSGQVQHQGLTNRIDFNYSPNQQAFVGRSTFDTTNKFGHLVYDITIRSHIYGLPDTKIDLQYAKEIGYSINVKSSAKNEITGKHIEENEVVAVGSSFAFFLSLSNTTNKFVQGDFTVGFTVFDSSVVTLASETQNCIDNIKDIEFNYQLTSSNLPAGKLIFRFDVTDNKEQRPHSVTTLFYILEIPMIAANITFQDNADNEPYFQVGERVRVSMVPASFYDLRNVQNFPVDSNRKFSLQISSGNKRLLRTVPGKLSNEGGAYFFDFVVLNTFDSIGSQQISFVYTTYDNHSIPLANFNSRFEELYEESDALNFTVLAEPQLVDVRESPRAQDFHYGNEISYRFRVKDLRSGLYLLPSAYNPTATVYLALEHHSAASSAAGPRYFRSALVPASLVGQEFVIGWPINANAIQGSGVLILFAQDADGRPIEIYESSNKRLYRLQVNIGGQIDVSEKILSGADISGALSQTAFLVEFELSCEKKNLKDAQLVCLVEENGQLVSRLPVASNPVTGKYSVSYAHPEKSTSSSYHLTFYREIDRLRAADIDGSAKEDTTETSAKAVRPLFELDVDYTVSSFSGLPVRTEFLFLVVLGSAFGALTYKRIFYTKNHK